MTVPNKNERLTPAFRKAIETMYSSHEILSDPEKWLPEIQRMHRQNTLTKHPGDKNFIASLATPLINRFIAKDDFQSAFNALCWQRKRFSPNTSYMWTVLQTSYFLIGRAKEADTPEARRIIKQLTGWKRNSPISYGYKNN